MKKIRFLKCINTIVARLSTFDEIFDEFLMRVFLSAKVFWSHIFA